KQEISWGGGNPKAEMRVAVGLWPAVEGGVSPPGARRGTRPDTDWSLSRLQPPGKMPDSTAGQRPAATRMRISDFFRISGPHAWLECAHDSSRPGGGPDGPFYPVLTRVYPSTPFYPLLPLLPNNG